MIKLRPLYDLPAEKLAGRRVLLRLDLNVPLEADKVTSAFRLEKILPTLKWLQERGARTVVLSHHSNPARSLLPVVRELEKNLRLGFLSWERRGELQTLGTGDIAVLENLRRQSGEELNDPAFAARLAALGELYVNDAFAVSHRKHASIVGLPRFLPGYIGPLFLSEVEHLSRLFDPERPLAVVIGGAKFNTKLPLIKKFLPLADYLCIGGALANSFFAAKGFNLGRSLVETDKRLAALLNEEKILLPRDVVVADESGASAAKTPEALAEADAIVDVGPDTVTNWRPALAAAKTILWNGPLGNYELGFVAATHALAREIAGLAAYSVVGGGDTLAAIAALGLESKFGFVSTGGGALLEFLATGTLPGIEALRES